MRDLDRLKELYQERKLADAIRLYTDQARRCRDPEWHLYGALALWRERAVYAARTAADRALACKPDGQILVRVLFIAGVVYRELGEIRTAISHLDDCLTALETEIDLAPVLRGAAYYNKALALASTPSVDEAMATYGLAIAEFRRESMSDSLRQGLQNLAWLASESGDLPRAETALLESDELCMTSEAQWHQRCNWAHMLGRRGEHREAMRLIQVIIDAQDVPAAVRCYGYIAAAHIAIEMGMMTEAETMAKFAVKESTVTGPDLDERCFRAASAALAKVRQLRGA